MKAAASLLAPQMIQWSPGGVKTLDMVTRSVGYSAGIAELGAAIPTGREVVVAISQRSAFIRSVSVPNVSRDEIGKILRLKLGPVLPLSPNEYVFGFRLAHDSRSGSRAAIVGAIKSEALRRIHQEAKLRGLRVRSVVPLAFGSWLAAKAHSLADCAVVQVSGDQITIDLIEGGELRYSRTAPLTESADEISDEVVRTFKIAELRPAPVLALASPEVAADYHDPKEALEYLADSHSIDRSLFTIELPETVSAREARARGRTAQRALSVAAVALVLGGMAYRRQSVMIADEAAFKARTIKSLSAETARRAAQDARESASKSLAWLVAAAFEPKQRFTDVVAELGSPVPKDMWLTGITLERGKPVVLRGYSTNGTSVARYAAELNRNPRFRDMKVNFANEASIEKKQVVQFSIAGHIVGNFPIDVPVTVGGKP